MRLVWVVIPLVLIGIVGISESFADTDTKHKPPYQQIRDDGVFPKDVQCNEGKILFFKRGSGSPICVYEDSILKLNSKDNKFMFWNLKNHLIDWKHLQENIRELEFNGITKVSLSEPYDSSTSEFPKIKFIQELNADKNKIVIFYEPIFGVTRDFDIEPKTKSNFNLYDPRSINYVGLHDVRYGFQFQCDDGKNRISGYDPTIFSFSMIEKLFLIEYSQPYHGNNVSKLNGTYNYEYGSLFPTDFEFSEPLSVKTIKEIQCTANDDVFTNVYEILYFYIIEFEMNS